MVCKSCGKVVPDGTEYCRSCADPIPSVGFVDAIKLFFGNYSNFSGRARRSEYWMAYLFTGLVSTGLSLIHPILGSIWALVIAVPSIAICIRRLHDIGKSGWWYLMICVPLVGQILYLIWVCTDSKEENQWGPNPKYRVNRGTVAEAVVAQPAFEPVHGPVVLPPAGGAIKPMTGPENFPMTTAPTSSHAFSDTPAIPKPAVPTVPAFSVTLILCTGPAAGNQFTFQSGQKVVLGRAQPGTHNAVLARYDRVSGTHCRLDVTGSGLTVTDLGSTNGTIVNGQRLTPQVGIPVPHGGVIFLADNNCVFQVKYNN